MNIYDKLNDLTKAIRQSEEFRRYEKAANAVEANETHSRMLKDFITMQMQITTSRMLGQDPDNDTIEHFNTLYTTISNVGAVSEFLQAQMFFSRIMDDVSKEISQAAQVDVEFLKILPDAAGADEE